MKQRPCVAIIFWLLQATAIAVILTIGSSAQTATIVHSFTGGSDGGLPFGGLVLDSKGNLYGTTLGGGANPLCVCGTAFQLVPEPNGTWTETVLYSFGSALNQSDGTSPQGPLTFDGKGNFYGTASGGGASASGAVFELTPTASGPWTESVLYSFAGRSDGYTPYSGVVLDSSGSLYGLIYGGSHGFGAVFELVKAANGTWTKKTLYNFTNGNDGGYPSGTLLFDQAGNLYGVAEEGGTHDYGVVFKLTHGSNGTWTESVAHSFAGGTGGSYPSGGLVSDSAGNIYGVANYVLFELTPGSNGTWTEKTLHTFPGGADGAAALAGLTIDKAGNLYGTTANGGAHRGTVFELTPGSNGTWTEKILHRFSSTGGDGVFPAAGVALDRTGNVYGTTPSGGTSNAGVVFEVKP
jgi:uncharacterized repeat protein (TIGR03803 family)